MEEARLRERSNIYEQALQRSIMLKGDGKSRLTNVQASSAGRSAKLPTMREISDLEEDAEGWETKMIKQQDLEDLDVAEEGRVKDDGMLHMLQDVIRR